MSGHGHVVVTGGTGFLGEEVCRELKSRGVPTVALARTRSDVLDDLGIPSVRGDVQNGDELDQALVGARAVFHLAGFVSRNPDDANAMMRLHVEGTRRVFERMKAAGVPRMILASTSGTVAVSKREEILDESHGYATEVVAGWPYYASKIYQETLALDLGRKHDIEVVAVNPTLLLGPGDRRLSSSGDVRRFLRRQIPVVPAGGMSFVDVRDAAVATVNALTAGRAGERYLLGGPNWSVKEFFARLARVSGVAAPVLRLPARWNRWGASVVEELYRRGGRTPPVDRISVEMAEHYWWQDCRKAERELGFAARDPSLTLHETVRYLRAGI